MSLFDEIYPLGLGTNRFPISNMDDETGIEQSTQLVLHALNAGVNYIDVAPGYSRGMAFEVLRRAFLQTRKKYMVTLKSRSDIDRTADDVRRRAELSLRAMDIDKASYAVAWSIFSFSEFKQIISKNGSFEGMRKLQEEGIVDHIGFSTHAPASDIIKILESGIFESMTISYSLLNSVSMQSVLDVAYERKVGVVVMNPMGGGLISQNRDFFKFIRNINERNVVQSALRFVKAHPAVNVLLSGVSTLEELEENLSAFREPDLESGKTRLHRVNTQLRSLDHFCTGCSYCAGCPQEIPVSSYMQSRNTLLFKPVEAYHRTDPELLRNIQLLRKLSMDFNILPETPENPCVKCGQCEAKCTQKLNIIDALEDIFNRVTDSGFSKEAHMKRLDSLLNGHGYTSVGIYPSGGYFAWVNAMYHSFFGKPPFEYILFNSDPKTWGTLQDEYVIHDPKEISKLRPDVILVCNYNYSDEIDESIKHYEKDGIEVIKLHEPTDVPWLF